jgi:hypothetical protein
MPRPTRQQFPAAGEYAARLSYWHEKLQALAEKVDACVEEQYGLTDGGDLCYNLMDSGTIPEDATVDEAARIVAQHLLQA